LYSIEKEYIYINLLRNFGFKDCSYQTRTDEILQIDDTISPPKEKLNNISQTQKPIQLVFDLYNKYTI